MTNRRATDSDFDRPLSMDDPYHFQRLEERRQAKLARAKEKLRKKAGKGPSREKAQREPVTSIEKVEQDRGRKNSRRKGNRNELDVAKLFSKWSGELVKRTPGSGGWGGAQEFGTTADLICKKKAFPFHVEVKHREGWVLDDLVTGVRKEHDKSIVQWWIQCLQSCPKYKGKKNYTAWQKEPLLVFRRNRQPWLVMVRAHVPARRTCMFLIQTEEFGSQEVVVMLLEDFLEITPAPEGLKNHR